MGMYKNKIALRQKKNNSNNFHRQKIFKDKKQQLERAGLFS